MTCVHHLRYLNVVRCSHSCLTWLVWCVCVNTSVKITRSYYVSKVQHMVSMIETIPTLGILINCITEQMPGMQCWTVWVHGRVTHICVGKLAIIGSDNGLSPGRRQAIIWTSAGILWIGRLGTNLSENAFENVVWKMASILPWPQCVINN